ncbi:MAG: trypsin-like peptidase domain-containing protein [Nanoarchaeota archaeon]|nr:trypsin-like peptidase domain-containing protein [Nanoarchaeota archaeon]
MVNLNLNSNKVLIISIVLLLVATGSLIFYYNNKVDELNSKILILNNEMVSNLKELKEVLTNDISSLNDNLTYEIDIVDNDLRNFKTQNKKEINTLSDLIDEIEKQTEIQLGELKDELKDIKVKSKDFTAIINDVIQSVVSIGTNKGLGSGVVIDDRGFIVTNYHVVNGASIIRILTYDENVYDATLIGFNDVVDVAVLKVDASLPDLRFGDSDDVLVGERVIALGNPAGLSFTVTEGIVSAVHRTGPNNQEIYLQTDVPINPGNSGGPLVNIESKIIGLNNFKIGGFEGLGFAIESNTVEGIVDDIIAQYLQTQQE